MKQAIWEEYLDKHKDRFLEELLALLRIPSVSAKKEHQKDICYCAEEIKKQMDMVGLKSTHIYTTPGHPIVYGEYILNPEYPTVLVYGHYDVQPVDPIELWHHPPFTPTIKDGKIYARGSSDDKGQMFMHIKAFELMYKTNTIPSVNIKFIIEGEEEVGSKHLEHFLKEHKDLLKADIVLISDSHLNSLEEPSLDVSVRGLVYFEVTLTGPNRDLHSGIFGGAVANPNLILSKMLASLHDENNHITIPHFYDDVLSFSEEERKNINKHPFDSNMYKKSLEVQELWGEKGYTTLERVGIRPTLEVNGIWGGYIGEGAKTVLPSKASAKISCRLVANQSAERIFNLVSNHLRKITPPSVKIDIVLLGGLGDPYNLDTTHKGYIAASKAMQETLNGKEPFPVHGGGSIPITISFERVLGCKSIFLGFGLEDDNLHSPNEKYNIINFYKGIETIPYFYKHFVSLH